MEMLLSGSKRVSISSKRQITIPQKYFTDLGFDKEAICSVENGRLILTPAEKVSGGEFAELILADLIKEGFSGELLLQEFKKRQALVRPAVEKILQQGKDAAYGKGDYYTYDEIFDTGDE